MSMVTRIAAMRRGDRTAIHKHGDDRREGQCGDQARALAERTELLVVERRRPGQADADAVRRVEAQGAGGSADEIAVESAPGCKLG